MSFSKPEQSFSKPEQLLAHELSCPICLQIFSDPVALPCGHNYCLACIRHAADTLVTKTLPRCPECREEYDGLESLHKNFKLSGIIEGYWAAGATRPPLDIGQEEMAGKPVLCDHCIDKETPAVKTCVGCQVCLCERHLEKHGQKESFRRHMLVEPNSKLDTMGCAVHGRPLEYFCSSDTTTLCATCFIEGQHQNHDIITFDIAEEEMRRVLENRSKVVCSRLQFTDTLLQRAAEEQGASEAIGDKLVNKAVSVMDNMAALVNRYKERLSVLLEEERRHRRQSLKLGMASLEEQQQQLQEAQGSSKQALAEADRGLFIHRYLLIEPQLREAATGTVCSKIPIIEPLNTQRLQAGLRTQEFRGEMSRLLESLHVLLNPQELTFNLSTAHPSLLLSTDLRTIKCTGTKQSYVDHPERFTSAPQVLCGQGFSSGEHVWVLEVGDHSMWSMGLCYKSILRRGDHSRLGHNAISWRLQWKNKKLTACHASSNVSLGETASQPVKVEVSLDYEGGTLAFHSTKGLREHLHTFKAAFREPVYPAFSILSSTPESWITLQSGM